MGADLTLSNALALRVPANQVKQLHQLQFTVMAAHNTLPLIEDSEFYIFVNLDNGEVTFSLQFNGIAKDDDGSIENPKTKRIGLTQTTLQAVVQHIPAGRGLDKSDTSEISVPKKEV